MIRSERGEKKLDWWVKWVASIIVLSAITFRSAGAEYHMLDLYLSSVGILLWLWVSLLWEDRALILLNGVSFFLLLTGLVKEHGQWWWNFWSSLFLN